MKKQILVLVILVVAVFASVTKSYGQAIAGLAPRVASGADDASHPIAGKPYDYSAIINPVGGTASWYATKSTTFMTAGARVATPIVNDATGATGVKATNYNTPGIVVASPPSTTNITWSGAVLSGVNATTSPLFVVVEYTGPVAGCANNNIKVMQITPVSAFTIDLTNMTHATPTALAYGAAENQCYAGIVSSGWDVASGKMINDYGVNTLYFELVAANFYGGFKPQFKLTGLKSTQTADIAWDVAVGGTYANVVGTGINLGAMPYTSAPGAQTVTTALTSTNGGAAIYIKVTVNNHGYEGLTADDITLAVDAVDNAGNDDVDDVTPALGTAKGAFTELAKQTLNARPDVTAGTGVTFITQQP
jgi:hypothetical protein